MYKHRRYMLLTTVLLNWIVCLFFSSLLEMSLNSDGIYFKMCNLIICTKLYMDKINRH